MQVAAAACSTSTAGPSSAADGEQPAAGIPAWKLLDVSDGGNCCPAVDAGPPGAAERQQQQQNGGSEQGGSNECVLSGMTIR